MPDPGDTAAGDTGVGTGWSRDDNTSTGSSSVGFSGGTLNGSDNYSGGNWGGSNSSGNNWGGSNSSSSNWTGSDSGNSSSYGFSGGTLNGSDNYSGNNWGGTNSGSPVGTNVSTTSPNGGIAGALNAGLGSNYVTSSYGASLGSYLSQSDVLRRTYTSSPQIAPNGSYYGPKGINSLNSDARYAAARQQGYFGPQVGATPRATNMMASVMLAESGPIKNAYGGLNTAALQGVGDVIRNRTISPQFPNTVGGVLNQPYAFEPVLNNSYKNYGPASPNFAMAQSLAKSILSGETPPVVGGAVNFGNVATIKNYDKASQKTKTAFAAMAADPNSITFRDARRPNSIQHTFGNLPGSNPVALSTGPLSDPATTGPIQLAMGSMGGSWSSTAPVLSDPYTNIADKGDLQQSASGYPSSQYAGYGNFNYPSVSNSTEFAGNTVPSWQQSAYTGPIQTAMNETPSVPPSQEGEPIPFPVDEDSLGYKTWRGLTYVGDQLIPGSGMMLRKMDEDLKQRWPSMTNAERQALIDRWDGNNSPSGSSTVSYGSGTLDPGVGGADRGNYQTSMVTQPVQQNLQQYQQDQSSDDTTWKRVALMYGFTPQQVNDPQTAEYIKQLYDMGWFA